MAKYSITYYNGDVMQYVESRMFESAANALVRAVMHINARPGVLDGAAILYHAKRGTKRVRSVRLWNHDPKFT